jgi:hypothetical protein
MLDNLSYVEHPAKRVEPLSAAVTVQVVVRSRAVPETSGASAASAIRRTRRALLRRYFAMIGRHGAGEPPGFVAAARGGCRCFQLVGDERGRAGDPPACPAAIIAPPRFSAGYVNWRMIRRRVHIATRRPSGRRCLIGVAGAGAPASGSGSRLRRVPAAP